MEEKKNNNIVIVLIVFIFLSLLLGGYIVYDKVVNVNNEKSSSDKNQNSLNNNDINSNDIFEKFIGVYKYTIDTGDNGCGIIEKILTIRNDGTADFIYNSCGETFTANNVIFSFNKNQIYLIDKKCEMLSTERNPSCSIGGGCYSGGCSPLWTFDYSFDGSKITINDLIKQES